MSVLLVVESPNKAKSIRKYFPDYIVVATVGHFRDLPEDELGVEPPEHIPRYVTQAGKADIEKKLRAAANKASIIYLATDPDREGEAIAGHVANVLGAKHKSKIHRVTYSEVNKKAITDAIARKRGIDWKLVRAQEARRVIDRYVGYLVSPTLTNVFQQVKPDIHFLSAGRVQTIALKLVVERKREIENFRPVEHYGVVASCAINHSDFKAVWAPFYNVTSIQTGAAEKPENEGTEPSRLMIDKSLADAVAKRTDSLTVVNINKKPSMVQPPKPLITSEYVKRMAKLFKLTTKQSMDIAQKLFEKGLITYHRTDSPVMSQEAVYAVRDFAKKQQLPVPDKARVIKAKAGSQEGHECLRVTDINVARAMTGDDLLDKAYRFVWLTTLQSQLAPAEDEKTQAIMENQAGDKFVTRGTIEIKRGWREAIKLAPEFAPKAQTKAKADENQLPPLKDNQTITPESVIVETKITKPPAAYTEESLVEKLDKLGIGRPSTYAQVLERITEQVFVTRDKALRFESTALGESVIDILDKQFAFTQYEYTAELESLFDQIADRNNPMEYLPVVDAVYTSLEADIEALENHALPSDVVERMRSVQTRRKPKKKAGQSSNKKAAKAVSETAPKVTEGAACPTCNTGKQVIKTFKSGKNEGKQYGACTRYPECKHFQWAQ